MILNSLKETILRNQQVVIHFETLNNSVLPIFFHTHILKKIFIIYLWHLNIEEPSTAAVDAVTERNLDMEEDKQLPQLAVDEQEQLVNERLSEEQLGQLDETSMKQIERILCL